jgi:hypothetical protein
MNYGLEIWSASGQLMLDSSHRIGRIKGAVRIDGNNGSFACDMSDGTPFYSFQPDQMFFHISNQTPPPIITLSATGVFWIYSSTAGMNFPNPIKGMLFLGVY